MACIASVYYCYCVYICSYSKESIDGVVVFVPKNVDGNS
jgi:hypothetical protein